MVDDKVVLVIDQTAQVGRKAQPTLAGMLLRKQTALIAALLAGLAGIGIHAAFQADESQPLQQDVADARKASHAGLSGLKLSSTVSMPAASAATPMNLQLSTAVAEQAGATLAVDLDGDGLPELVSANARSAELIINGRPVASDDRPAFSAAWTVALRSPATMLAAGDIDGDGRPDLLATNETASTVEVLINTTPAASGRAHAAQTDVTFKASEALDLGSPRSAMLLADVSGDGMADLIALQRLDHETDLPASLAVRVNVSSRGGPEFAPARRFQTGYLANGLAAADFDGDGRTDLAVSNGGSGTITVLRNSSLLTMNFSVDQTLAARRGVRGLITGDLDGDDQPDLVVIEPGDDRIALYRNQDGRYGDPVEVAATTPSAVGLADLRGDSRPELIIGHGSDGGVGMRVDVAPRGSVHPRFLPEIALLASGAQASIIAADLDGDRRVDVALQPVDAGDGSAWVPAASMSLFQHPFARERSSKFAETLDLVVTLTAPPSDGPKQIAADSPRRATQ